MDTLIIDSVSSGYLLLESIENPENLFLSAVSTLPEFRLATQDSLFAAYDIKRVKGQYAPSLDLIRQFIFPISTICND